MRRVSYSTPSGPSWGALGSDDDVVDLGVARPDLGLPTLVASLGASSTLLGAAVGDRGTVHRLDDLDLLPVVPHPGKILCVGLNFERHRIETGRERTPHPVVFTRFADSIVGHDSPLVRPAASSKLDYEGELAVVVGRGGRRISRATALDHVAGVTCFNDGSVRDFQAHTHQFTPGKNFPASGSLGPWLTDLTDLADLGQLELTTRLNGAVVQQASLGDLTYSIPEIIEYCSSWTRLEPGDVIGTGTPGGIGARRTPPLWLSPGDVCEVEIGGVAVLSNRVVEEDV